MEEASGAGDNVGTLHADVAQLVEHNLAKVGVAGSNPVVRSTRTRRDLPAAGEGKPLTWGDVPWWRQIEGDAVGRILGGVPAPDEVTDALRAVRP